MKSRKPLVRRTPLRKVSKKKVAENRELRKIKVHMGEINYCARCKKQAFWLHAHHLKPKGRGGKTEAANLVWVDPICHEWIHAHPLEAEKEGWLLK